MISYYEVLGVTPESTIPEIKQAYKLKLLSSHPDKIENVSAQIDIPLIKQAFTTLIDPTSRKTYDQQLLESTKLSGFNINGGGLDIYSLDDFEFLEDQEKWIKACPRCTSQNSICLTETDLEKGTPDKDGGFDIIVQCNSCSLWIQVKYYEE
ncbi:JJJ3 Diphthamide biosynthesis protein 4 [Candida maltosa Xu316]